MQEPQDPIADSELANTWVTGSGQVIRNVHSAALCEGRGCVIHHPSEHHMADWPTNFRGPIHVEGRPDLSAVLSWVEMGDDKPPYTERICEHGVGHPDPDDVGYWAGRGYDITRHGCDGCCSPPDALQ